MGVIYLLCAIVLMILVGLIGYIIVTGLPYVNWTFLTTPADSMGMGGGIRDQLFNSLYLLVLTLIISVPLSLGAGIYLAEYAPKNAVTKVIRSAIEVLSSLPSIVIGLFGYLFFVVKMGMGFSVLAGAIALTFFNTPSLNQKLRKRPGRSARRSPCRGIGAGAFALEDGDQDYDSRSDPGGFNRDHPECRTDLRGSRRLDLHLGAKRSRGQLR